MLHRILRIRMNNNKERKILINQIRTPDGTLLVSRHVHDYVRHYDKNGHEYAIDGGQSYLSRQISKNAPEYEELSVFEDDPFELIRQHCSRGGRGKDGKGDLTWVPLMNMSNEWLKNVIFYNNKNGLYGYTYFYGLELIYRRNNNIFIDDEI